MPFFPFPFFPILLFPLLAPLRTRFAHDRVSLFIDEGNCTTSCGGGLQKQERSVVVKPAYGGKKCPVNNTKTLACNTDPCPIDCKMAPWTNFSTCNADCGPGKKKRTRVKQMPARHGGKACDDDSTEDFDPCNDGPCPVSCKLGPWGGFSKCSRDCGNGTKTRTRLKLVEAQHGGNPCPDSDLRDEDKCFDKPCPINCVVGPWITDKSEKSEAGDGCSKTCGGGLQLQRRDIVTEAKFGGKACPKIVRKQVCNDDPCPLDCQVSDWEDVSLDAPDLSCCAMREGTDDDASLAAVKTLPKNMFVEVLEGRRTTKWFPTPFKALAKNVRFAALPGPQGATGAAGLQGATGATGATGPQGAASGTDVAKVVKAVSGNETKVAKPILKKGKAAIVASPCKVRGGNGEKGRCTKIPGCGYSTAKGCFKMAAAAAKNGTVVCDAIATAQYATKEAASKMKEEDCKKTLVAELSKITKKTSVKELQKKSAAELIKMLPKNLAAKPKAQPMCGKGALKQLTRGMVVNSTDYCCPKASCGGPDQPPPRVCTAKCGGGAKKQTREVRAAAAHGGKACPVLSRTITCNNQQCAIDCQLSEWTAQGDCSATCGGGNQTETRKVAAKPFHGGRACSTQLNRTVQCNREACPIDCAVGEFAREGNCSVPCGGGTQREVRKVLVPAQHSGRICPKLDRKVECAVDPCPVNCAMGTYGPWSPCDSKCGPGQKKRSRVKVAAAMNGGDECQDDGVVDTESCLSEPCPVDCKLSEWTPWEDCFNDGGCGNGTKFRSRKALTVVQFGGKACPAGSLNETASCALKPCPIQCALGPWFPHPSALAAKCSKTCGSGKRTEVRATLIEPQHGGDACPVLQRQVKCNEEQCPVDCVVGAWRSVGQCSEECGGGSIRQMREVVVNDRYGGKECPDLYRTTSCGEEPCGVDCQMDEWTNAMPRTSEEEQQGKQMQEQQLKSATAFLEQGGQGDSSSEQQQQQQQQNEASLTRAEQYIENGYCSKPCGGGKREMTREVSSPDMYGGKTCPSRNKTVSCNEQPCPVDCAFSPWNKAGSCSRSCDGGLLPEVRMILTMPQHGGEACPSPLMRQVACAVEACPLDCEVGEWSSLDGQCTKQCDGGDMVEVREITMFPMFNGAKCPALTRKVPCNQNPCPDAAELSCIMSGWVKDPTAPNCTQTCGGGIQREIKEMVKPATTSKGIVGSPCPPKNEKGRTLREVSCGMSPCPVDCKVSDWIGIGQCSATCGGGTVNQVRMVLSNAMYGGKKCPRKMQRMADCNMDMCPMDCVMSEWRDDGGCSAECGTGAQNRSRYVMEYDMYGGVPCPDEYEQPDAMMMQEKCNEQPCAVDCVAGPWESIGKCTKTCGGGEQVQKKEVLVQPANGGKQCPLMERSLPCGDAPCPVDCLMGDWTPYGECDSECGPGQKTRTRTKAQEAMYGGQECLDESLSAATECSSEPCPVDCKMSAWSDWASCSNPKGCGKGSRMRTRQKLTTSLFGGVQCPNPAQAESEECDLGPCTVDCKMSDWSLWGECESQNGCGKGNRRRSRHKLTFAAFGGAVCPSSHMDDSQPCLMDRQCDMDCEMSDWREVQSCTKTCGGGTMTQMRTVVKPAVAGGAPCGRMSRQTPCAEEECPVVDCQTGPWFDVGTCSATCKGGFVTKMRHILKQARHGGKSCPATVKKEECGKGPCPGHDCKMTDWIDTTACMNGKKVQIRRAAEPALDGGTPCPTELTKTVDCKESDKDSQEHDHVAKLKREMSATQSELAMLRQEVSNLKNGGAGAVGPAAAIAGGSAPSMGGSGADCKLGDWSSGVCDKTCGGGMMMMVRTVVSSAGPGGKPCPSDLMRSSECNPRPCSGDRHRVKRYVDIDGDTRTDIAILGLPASANALPVWFSNGRVGGQYNLNDGAYFDFVHKAAVQGVTPVMGDFNGDGKTDIALIGPPSHGATGWPVPIAFSQGRKGFKIMQGLPVKSIDQEGRATDPSPSSVLVLASTARKLMGDFDGDGKSDVAFLLPIDGGGDEVTETLPILYGEADGAKNLRLFDSRVGQFGQFCQSTKAAVGDFDGDGKDDIICTSGSKFDSATDALPVAYSGGRVSPWVVEIGEAEGFVALASAAGVEIVVGDFDGDGKHDVAIVGNGAVHVAFSNGRGQWSVAKGSASAHAKDATDPTVGDFDGDGKDDIVLIAGGSVIGLFSKGRDGFEAVVDKKAGVWPIRAAGQGVRRLVGDYDGDGRADIALAGDAGTGNLDILFGKSEARGFTLQSSTSPMLLQQVRMALAREP